MASNFTAVNPKVLSTPEPTGLPLVYELAANSKTWKKGQIGEKSSGLWQPIGTTGVTGPYCIFAEDQDTSTSSTYAWIRKIEPGTRLEIYVAANGSASAIGAANLGTKYGIRTASNIAYLDTAQTSGADFEVEDLAARYEPIQNAAADTPGKCIVVLR
jgi:hypothetical protein